MTLVSQPVNGEPGCLAFQNRRLVAIIVLHTRDGCIDYIHAIADPRKLAFVSTQLTRSTRVG
jgi:hypothetical protein